jgi:hypothetical protein
MAYGSIKVDNIVFTNGGVDQTVTVSGIVQSISGNITATGTIQGATIIGTSSVSGATVTGDAGQFTTATAATGVFTSTLSGATITGNAASFTTITGGTVTLTSGVFASGTAAAPSVSIGTTDNGLYSPGTDQVAISTNGTGRLFINSSGQVGVGTSPVSTFHVNGTGRFEAGQSLICNGTTGTYATWLYNGTAVGDIGTANQAVSGGSNTDFALTTRSSTNLVFGIGTSERMRLDSSGRLGLGTSSPGVPFHVQSGLSGNEVARILNTSGFGLRIVPQATGSTTAIRVASGESLRFDTNGANPALTIDTSQRVGIGTTSVSNTLHIAKEANHGITLERTVSNPGSVTLNVNSFGAASLTAANSVEITAAAGASTAFKIGSTEAARIDSSSRLLVGTSSAYTSRLLQIEGTSGSTTNISIVRHEANSNAPVIEFHKTRGTSNGSKTLVQDGDGTGTILFTGADGTNNLINARIEAFVDGTPGTNDMPGRLVFSVTADGASTPSERMRISNSGNTSFSGAVLPSSDNTYQFGAVGQRWTALYAVNGTIQTSDRREKTEITESSLGSDFVKSLKPVSYKFVTGGNEDVGVDKEGNCIYKAVPGKRTHWGFIAQEVKEVVDAAGVDFGGWVLTDTNNPDSPQGLRYDQFIAPLTKALQETMAELEALKAEVAALKAS